MRLTVYTDYTLRTLTYLGLSGDRRVTISEIAKHYGISGTHLMKVVHQLGGAGDIETIRGKGGGIRLAKPPAAINVGKLVRRTEPDMEIVPCLAESGVCAIESSCVLQWALRDAREAFLRVLDRYTLADLIAPRHKLSALLDLPRPPSSNTTAAVQRGTERVAETDKGLRPLTALGPEAPAPQRP